MGMARFYHAWIYFYRLEVIPRGTKGDQSFWKCCETSIAPFPLEVQVCDLIDTVRFQVEHY